MRILFFGLCLALAGSALGAELKINFDDLAAGQSPTNFRPALAGTGTPGIWKIVTDAAPPALAPITSEARQAGAVFNRPVLAQLSSDPTDEHFPMFIYEGQVFKDFNLTTRFKIVSGAAEQMAGIVFRYQNASNFYVLRASALGRNVRFYKVVNGIRTDPLGPALDVPIGVWHTLGVQCLGDQITCWFDGRPLMNTLNDNSFSSGKIGFWTKSDAVSYFADTTIDYTPIVPAAQLLIGDILKQFPRIVGLRIYMPDANGQIRIFASKDEKEIGRPGTDAESNTLASGAIYYGRGKGTASVDMPLEDRNGVPIAAVRIQLKSAAIGETQDMVLDRARIVINAMQKRVTLKEDLTQ